MEKNKVKQRIIEKEKKTIEKKNCENDFLTIMVHT